MAYEASRLLFLLIVLFFFLGPDPKGPSISRLQDLQNQVFSESAALQTLNSSEYGSFDIGHERWLNLTGLRKADGFAWQSLTGVKERARFRFDRAVLATPSQDGNQSAFLALGDGQEPLDSERLAQSVAPYREGLSMYDNVTSVLRGKWARSVLEDLHEASPINITTIAPNVSYTTSQMSRNITGSEGDLRVKLIEQSADKTFGIDPGLIRKIKLEVVIKDETSTGDGWVTVLYGVHFVRRGSIVATTTSEKFDGVFALPHFTHSSDAFALSQKFLVEDIADVIKKQNTSSDVLLSPWTSMSDANANGPSLVPHCELVIYLQQEPPQTPSTSFQAIEAELRRPTGARLGQAPRIQMSAIIFSPDCQFMLESKGPPDHTPASGQHLRGRKIEAYMNETRDVILMFILLICAQILLLKHQMNEASTPSTRSRISFYTIIVMALGDGFACLSLLVAGMIMDDLFLALVSAAFLCFLCVGFFGMKFLMDIWNVQAPERLERERERQRLRSQRSSESSPPQLGNDNSRRRESATITTSTGSPEPGTLPLPATAPRLPPNRTSTPIIITPDQDIEASIQDDATALLPTANNATPTNPQQPTDTHREFSAIYTRFYFTLLTLLFTSLWATSWPTTLRTLYTNILSLLYLSPFLPQIHRNIQRNCRKALTWRFVLGESLVRLAPFGYFWCWEDNILFTEIDATMFAVLAAWVWCQVFVLGVQDVVGPRVFVPDGWAPKAYDYHPILREGDPEAGGNMPIGFSDAMAESIDSPVASSSSAAAAATATGLSGEAKRKQDRKTEGSKRAFDCAICTETLEAPVVGLGETEGALTPATVFARRGYMVTPCRHIFHSSCLEGWMRYRLQCPICREGIPPL